MVATTPKSIRTSGLIFDTAVKELSVTGLDHVTFTSIARAAGLTTGAMYSRFENSAELLVSLWQERLYPEFARFINCYVAALNDPEDIAALEELGRLIADPTPELLLAAEAISVAPRIDELFEVVAPLMDVLLDTEPRLKAVHFGALTVILGSLMYFQFSSAQKFIPTVVENGVRVGRVKDVKEYGPVGKLDIQTFEADVAGSDPLIRDLLVATRAVIAKSGFERATVSRIARKWGHNSATIYQYFENKSELMASVVELALRSSLIMRHSESSPEDYISSGAQTITSHLSEERRPYLRFRLEAHVAALHNPNVADVMRSEYARYRDRMLANSSSPRGITTAASEGANAAYIGRAMLFPYAPDCGNYEWRPYSEASVTALLNIYSVSVK